MGSIRDLGLHSPLEPPSPKKLAKQTWDPPYPQPSALACPTKAPAKPREPKAHQLLGPRIPTFLFGMSIGSATLSGPHAVGLSCAKAMVCLGNGVYRLSGVPRMHERPQKEGPSREFRCRAVGTKNARGGGGRRNSDHRELGGDGGSKQDLSARSDVWVLWCRLWVLVHVS